MKKTTQEIKDFRMKNIKIQEDMMEKVIVLQKIVDRKMTQKEGGEELGYTERHGW